MKLYDECRNCLYNSQLKKVTSTHGDDPKLPVFKERVRALCDSAPENSCAPLLMRGIDDIHREIFGGPIDYSNEKRAFNNALLDMEEAIYARISAADDPVKEGIKYAMAANYIDYARLSGLSGDSIAKVIDAADRAETDDGVYEKFAAALNGANTIAYLHDNCGEIVLDKLLIRAIKGAYPRINVISIVRGGAVINDVTRLDAGETGLNKLAYVADNGTNIPGTYLPGVNALTRAFIKNADVVIAKGLGNLETLYGEVPGAFYMFMCKCEHIAEKFGKKVWDTAFVCDEPTDGAFDGEGAV